MPLRMDLMERKGTAQQSPWLIHYDNLLQKGEVFIRINAIPPWKAFEDERGMGKSTMKGQGL